MGEVMFGYDTKLDRPVAVKFIQRVCADDDQRRRELVQRFVRESRITARLEHPGVPVVYDCGTVDGDHYLVMQLIDGSPLSAILAELRPLPIAWAAAIAAQVCSVLAVAHAHSLVHRDLKPANLMLCPDGTVKVLDFGIATAHTAYEPTLTHVGTAMGTPQYMAPEQAEKGVTSPQGDLYAVGVLLDEMLTGHNQFGATTALATMRNQMQLIPRPVRAVRSDAPPELEHLVLQLLAKDPAERPGSAFDVYQRLAAHCRRLPPLAGYVEPGADHPLRMYAAVVGNVGMAQQSSRPSVIRHSGAFPEDVDGVRERARRLKSEGRYVQATQLLARIVERVSGADSLHVRVELADARFLSGDYLSAADDFAGLVPDLTRWMTPADPRVLRCRYMEAKCHAQLGDSAHALELLCSLLEDERRYGMDETHLQELRRQISQLELGVNMSLRPYVP